MSVGCELAVLSPLRLGFPNHKMGGWRVGEPGPWRLGATAPQAAGLVALHLAEARQPLDVEQGCESCLACT